jgi:hypothetical protein
VTHTSAITTPGGAPVLPYRRCGDGDFDDDENEPDPDAGIWLVCCTRHVLVCALNALLPWSRQASDHR